VEVGGPLLSAVQLRGPLDVLGRRRLDDPAPSVDDGQARDDDDDGDDGGAPAPAALLNVSAAAAAAAARS